MGTRGRRSRSQTPSLGDQWRFRCVLGIPRDSGVSTQSPGHIRRDALSSCPLETRSGRKKRLTKQGYRGDWKTRVDGVVSKKTHPLAGGTDATGGPVKTDAHNGIARHIPARRPFATGMPLGTARLCRLPVDGKGLQVIALSDLMLPTIGPKGRPDHIDLVLALRRDEEVGIHGTAVEQMGARQQIPCG